MRINSVLSGYDNEYKFLIEPHPVIVWCVRPSVMRDLPRLLGTMLEPLEDKERPVVELSSIKPGIATISVVYDYFLIHIIKIKN